MATLRLENIFKSFGETEVLKDISLGIEDKEFVVFVGPSGCGKTTLLRIICGLEEATSGKVFIDEEDVSNAQPVDRGISMVFQSYALYPHLSVFENIAFPLRVAKINEAELKERVDRAAEILQLTDRLEFKPGQLSGGQRQRIAIARAMLKDAPILLLDEATSALDTESERHIQTALTELMEGRTTGVIAHRLSTIEKSDCIYEFKNGEIIGFGTYQELLKKSKTFFDIVDIAKRRKKFNI